jgi:predicted small lipoprotein YifL
MVRIMLLLNVCGQHGPYHIVVERMWTTRAVLYYCRTHVDNMVRSMLLLIVCGQHGPYYIIVERM